MPPGAAAACVFVIQCRRTAAVQSVGAQHGVAINVAALAPDRGSAPQRMATIRSGDDQRECVLLLACAVTVTDHCCRDPPGAERDRAAVRPAEYRFVKLRLRKA